MKSRRFKVIPAPRRKPDETQLNTDIPNDLALELDEYTAEHGVHRKLIVAVALRRFLMSEKAERAKARMLANGPTVKT